jgi:hypothetical protein
MPESSFQATKEPESNIETKEGDYGQSLRQRACDLTTKELFEEASETIRKIQLLTHLSEPV